jgi:hypothetical protein
MKVKIWRQLDKHGWEDDIYYGGELYEEAFHKYAERLEHKEFARRHWTDQKVGA